MLSYYEALRTIFERADFERGERPPYAERIYRLSRVEELLEQLGNPQRAYRSVHIAGTKGKGSTTAMIEAILRAAGYHTGMYTSPHLHTFRERIRREGQLIAEDEVSDLIERMAPILRERPEVTVFEIITALAMWYYAEIGVQWGVFEVGMGGRLDATNILRPAVSVITSLSMDHMNVLGNTLEAIAREKAGIIKQGVPVVSAPQKPEALQVILDISDEREAPCTLVGRDWQWRFRGADLDGQRLDVFRPGHEDAPEYAGLTLPLLGQHQLENACAAIATMETLRERGVAIEREAVRQGIAAVEWPGRLEILGRKPLVVVDGAHNTYSMQCLLDATTTYLPHRQLHMIFGVGVTHTPQDLLTVVLPHVASFCITQSHHPKATPVADLQTMARELGYDATIAPNAGAALDAALDRAGADDLVLVTGSLFVVAEAREAWFSRQGLPLPPADPPGAY